MHYISIKYIHLSVLRVSRDLFFLNMLLFLKLDMLLSSLNITSDILSTNSGNLMQPRYISQVTYIQTHPRGGYRISEWGGGVRVTLNVAFFPLFMKFMGPPKGGVLTPRTPPPPWIRPCHLKTSILSFFRFINILKLT